MKVKNTIQGTDERRSFIAEAALDCFLKFGYAKTSLDDIAKTAKISRPLIYLSFKNKEEIFGATFTHLIGDSYEEAENLLSSNLSKRQKLVDLYELLVVRHWEKVSGKPMFSDYYRACSEVLPEMSQRHEAFLRKKLTAIFQDADLAEIFALAVVGLHSDMPSTKTLRKRIELLAKQFA